MCIDGSSPQMCNALKRKIYKNCTKGWSSDFFLQISGNMALFINYLTQAVTGEKMLLRFKGIDICVFMM